MKKQNKHYITTSLILSSLLFTSCYSWFEDKIKLDTTHDQTTLTDFLYQELPITSLNPPTQVIASQGEYSGSIKLAWDSVNHATSYRIERAVIQPDSNGLFNPPDDGDFEVIEKYVYRTTYEDIILSKPNSSNNEYNYKYYYRISAENIKYGYESSEYTDIFNDYTKGLGWLLPAPTNVDAWKGKSPDEIQISWAPVPNAMEYEIYRGEDTVSMQYLESIRANKTVYSNNITSANQGKEYYYKVCAKLSNGSTSAFSTPALGYSLRPGAPSAPSNISLTDGSGTNTESITVNWDKVTYTAPTAGSVTYSLYRTSSIDPTYTLVKSGIPVDTTSTKVDSGLQPGVKYYFYLQTIFEDSATNLKNKSAFSETGPKADNPVVGFLLSAPGDVELIDSTSNPNDVILRWTPAVGYDLLDSQYPYSYIIYYDDEQYGSFGNKVAKLDSTSLQLGSDGYYEFKTEKKNFFKIATVSSESSQESLLSYTVAPTPIAPDNVYASKTSNLGGIGNYKCNTNEVYPVKITWTESAEGAQGGYNIYRSTNPTSSFRKLNESPVTDLYYIDENETARAGTFYYYKVVSLNVLGQGKKGNDPSLGTDARGYGAITREQWFREYNKTIMKSQSKLTLMHKSNDMDKLGSETIEGKYGGTLSYKAAIAGLGAEITMHYENYCDFYANNNDTSCGVKYFVLTGNTDTTSNMSANGNMHEKVNCTGMYPGYAIYDNLQIKSGAAGGGYYLVQTTDLNGNIILGENKVDWLVGEE